MNHREKHIALHTETDYKHAHTDLLQNFLDVKYYKVISVKFSSLTNCVKLRAPM